MPRLFGTDGVRGLAGRDLTGELAYGLGRAAVAVLGQHGERRPSFVLGRDTRASGEFLEAALAAGICSAGGDVLLAGVQTTPAVAFLIADAGASAGAMISASHNPPDHNGIKFFSGDGFKLPDDTEAAIEAEMDQPMRCNQAAELGKVWRREDAGGRYIEFCKSTFPNELDLKGLKIVVDGAHGAAYNIVPHVFHELGAEVVAIGVKPDGLNINDGVGATKPTALQRAVAEHGADLGIALDGDGDRVAMVDAQGHAYDGDQLMFVIARHRVPCGAAKKALKGVAGTLMTNLAFEKAMTRLGVAFGRARVGDRYVLELMREKGWELGGENSGHVICLDKHTTGDGIVSALQVLHAVRESGRTLGELTADLVMYPQVLLNVAVPKGFDWKKHSAIKSAQADAERSLNGRGRVLLRPSGTEPVVRVMVEGEDKAHVQKLADGIAAVVKSSAAVAA